MPRSLVARFLEELILSEGTQQKLVAKIGSGISRPLVAQILNDKVTATTAAVASLCRACTPEQAAQLIAAHLEDELVRLITAYRSSPAPGWDGQLPDNLAIKTPKATSGVTPPLGRLVVDADSMSCFQIKDLGQA